MMQKKNRVSCWQENVPDTADNASTFMKGIVRETVGLRPVVLTCMATRTWTRTTRSKIPRAVETGSDFRRAGKRVVNLMHALNAYDKYQGIKSIRQLPESLATKRKLR